MQHVEGAPFGTRGGIAVMHTFPADGDYSFRLQLHSIPTGQLFGSQVKGELLEVAIDGERVAVLEINQRMSEADPNGMNITTPRIQVKAGTHRLAAAFVQRFDAVPDDLMPPIDHTLADTQIGAGVGITTLPHLREFAVSGPFKVTGISETPSRKKIFTCRPTTAAEEATCANDIIRKLATQAYRGPVTAADMDGLKKFYTQGRKDGGFRERHPHGAAGDSRQPALPVPPRGSAGDGARRPELPHHAISTSRRACRSSSGARVPTTNC